MRLDVDNYFLDEIFFIVHIEYDVKKDKYKFMTPSKSDIIQWVFNAYDKIDPKLVERSKF